MSQLKEPSPPNATSTRPGRARVLAASVALSGCITCAGGRRPDARVPRGPLECKGAARWVPGGVITSRCERQATFRRSPASSRHCDMLPRWACQAWASRSAPVAPMGAHSALHRVLTPWRVDTRLARPSGEAPHMPPNQATLLPLIHCATALIQSRSACGLAWGREPVPATLIERSGTRCGDAGGTDTPVVFK